MKSMVMRSLLLAAAFMTCFCTLGDDSAMGQGQFRPGLTSEPSTQPAFPNTPKAQTPATQPTGQVQQNSGMQKSPVIEPDRPWKMTSRIHLEKGTNKGYLVVQIDLDEGYYVYSLNPEGSPAPTRLAVLPSNDLKVQSKFVSDKPPHVIEKDPVFNQRIEKHKGQVQFFASIVVRPGVDLQKLAQEVQFSGQVCSDNACQPIRKQTATASFSGFFEVPKTRNASKEQKLK
ncbi:protein-disulfide reductase DsbD domain-containing protein [Mariniblastus fucicola]|uniref:Uncharacterized protein n=1 Tax=Mariniblastus fucicola TaxID=980251 RepID=A0A5B9P6X9_9BACT|nr:protein-disulfide reductase DsbD domain-containing protein [Mariniblastus fucicola]QEG20935.1 hypothetical protein MFFC18_07860 [Mariniblastus fucicola]